MTIRVTDTGSEVATVTVDGTPQTLVGGQCRYTVTETKDCVIVATDGNGNEATTTESVKIDRNAPTITFNPESKAELARSVTITPSIIEEESKIAVCKYYWSKTATTPTTETTYNNSTYGGTFTSTGTITSPEGVTGEYYLHVYLRDNAGNVTTDRTEGTFNLTDKYIISNEDELIQFYTDAHNSSTYNYFAGKTVYLVNDIVVRNNSWYPIYQFDGIFDGEYAGETHTISGLDNTFIKTNKGTIKNLGINSTFNTSNQNVGGIVSYNEGTIQNSYFQGNITSSGGVVGGIAAINKSTGKITGCHVESGSIIKSTKTSMSNEGCTGGIVADNGGSISQCYNEGTVIGGAAGGIAAYTTNYGTTTSKIEKCYNIGSVSGTLAGGIGNSMTISYCYNKGSINATRGAGGISYSLREEGSVIQYCYNAGDVRVSDSSASSSYHLPAGGIVSAMEVTSTVKYCYNKGSVMGQRETGGIVAYDCTTSNISNCYNAGRVTSTERTPGGIIGNGCKNITNCKFEYGTANDGFGNASTQSFTGATAVSVGTSDALSIVGTTNFQADTGINGGDPILRWQVQ